MNSTIPQSVSTLLALQTPIISPLPQPSAQVTQQPIAPINFTPPVQNSLNKLVQNQMETVSATPNSQVTSNTQVTSTPQAEPSQLPLSSTTSSMSFQATAFIIIASGTLVVSIIGILIWRYRMQKRNRARAEMRNSASIAVLPINPKNYSSRPFDTSFKTHQQEFPVPTSGYIYVASRNDRNSPFQPPEGDEPLRYHTSPFPILPVYQQTRHVQPINPLAQSPRITHTLSSSQSNVLPNATRYPSQEFNPMNGGDA